MKTKGFQFLEHTADVKFQAFGKTIEEAFESSALALKETICEKIKINEKKEIKIEVEGKDFESLLYNFLEEILYLLDAEDFLLKKIKEIKITENKKFSVLKTSKNQKEVPSNKKNFKLNAVVLGDKASSYRFTNPVKAITYSNMFVKKENNKWIIQVVLDV